MEANTEELRNEAFQSIIGAVVTASGEDGIVLKKGDTLYKIGVMSYLSPDGEDYEAFLSIGKLQEKD